MITPAASRFLIAFAALLPFCATAGDKKLDPNAPFGLPGPADTEREHYLIERPEYVLSYNATTCCPNWVCWRLRESDLGKAARGPFEPDPLLPRGFPKVTSHVYDGSGFDRGVRRDS